MNERLLNLLANTEKLSVRQVYELLCHLYDMPVTEIIPVAPGEMRIDLNDHHLTTIDGMLMSAGDRCTIAIRATLSSKSKERMRAFLVAEYQAHINEMWGRLVNMEDIPE